MLAQQDYQLRRAQLAQALIPDSVAIIMGAKEVLRNGDAHYRFRQASDFYYLTGFKEPDALLVIMAGNSGENYLFNRACHADEEQWTGTRLGQVGACVELGVTEAFPIEQLTVHMPRLLADKIAVYYSFGQERALEALLPHIFSLKKQRHGIAIDSYLNLEPIISEMRLIKSTHEINLIRHAVAKSVQAHQRAMRVCSTLNYEYQLEAELGYEMTRMGCRSYAYDPIVASGKNACILHYIDNNQPLKKGELVLIDAGGEFENYAADITRTFPINGVFTKPQRQIYQLVLDAQQAAIKCIKPGISWPLIQQIIVEILTQGLCHLGLLKGDLEHLIVNKAYQPFYMHNSGHWLGLDVHDSGRYKINQQWRELNAGMVLTVEPGLYIPVRSDIEEQWWNIGVRIEDDILVTSSGYENLSHALAVEINDIEDAMRA